MICGQRLENYWISNFRGDFQSALDTSCDVAFRNRKSDVLQHSLRVVLVLRDLDTDRAGRIGKRRLNAMKVPAESELDERIVVEPADGNSSSSRFLDNRSGGWSEQRRFVQRKQLIDEARRTNELLERIAARLEKGTVKVRVEAGSKDKREQGS